MALMDWLTYGKIPGGGWGKPGLVDPTGGGGGGGGGNPTTPPTPPPALAKFQFQPNLYDQAPAMGAGGNNPWLVTPQTQNWMSYASAPWGHQQQQNGQWPY